MKGARLFIGNTYKVSWMPTKYLYEHTGKLHRISATTLYFETPETYINIADNPSEYIEVQKKFIKSINII